MRLSSTCIVKYNMVCWPEEGKTKHKQIAISQLQAIETDSLESSKISLMLKVNQIFYFHSFYRNDNKIIRQASF